MPKDPIKRAFKKYKGVKTTLKCSGFDKSCKKPSADNRPPSTKISSPKPQSKEKIGSGVRYESKEQRIKRDIPKLSYEDKIETKKGVDKYTFKEDLKGNRKLIKHEVEKPMEKTGERTVKIKTGAEKKQEEAKKKYEGMKESTKDFLTKKKERKPKDVILRESTQYKKEKTPEGKTKGEYVSRWRLEDKDSVIIARYKKGKEDEAHGDVKGLMSIDKKKRSEVLRGLSRKQMKKYKTNKRYQDKIKGKFTKYEGEAKPKRMGRKKVQRGAF